MTTIDAGLLDWRHALSGPNLGGVVNPDSGVAILDSKMKKLTALDFTDKLKLRLENFKVAEHQDGKCGM